MNVDVVIDAEVIEVWRSGSKIQAMPRLAGDGKHSQWCNLNRPENLTDRQAVKLSELVKLNLRCVRAYLMRKDFQRFWQYVRHGRDGSWTSGAHERCEARSNR